MKYIRDREGIHEFYSSHTSDTTPTSRLYVANENVESESNERFT